MMNKNKSHKNIFKLKSSGKFPNTISCLNLYCKNPKLRYGQKSCKTWPLLLCSGQCRVTSNVLFSHALCIYLGILNLYRFRVERWTWLKQIRNTRGWYTCYKLMMTNFSNLISMALLANGFVMYSCSLDCIMLCAPHFPPCPCLFVCITIVLGWKLLYIYPQQISISTSLYVKIARLLSTMLLFRCTCTF
jgi:hypothetical protein